MGRSFNYITARPFGWIAFVLWVVAIAGQEFFGMSDSIQYSLFFIGTVVFIIGGIKGLKHE